MHSFLGIPIRIRGEAWGNIYLTEKQHGAPFTEADEATVVVLADWAAIAIEHARLYEAVDARRDELERAVRGFEATATIARAVGGETDLGRVLELIVKRARALVDARSVLILLLEGEVLTLASGAGHVLERETAVLRAVGSPFGEALARQHALRVEDVERELGLHPEELGVPDASAALLVPLTFRGRALGLLIAFDRLSGSAGFTEDDEQLLQVFAASAATAVAHAQTVEADRLRHSLRAAEEERRRWARELHDETLQGLAGLKVLVSGAARRGDPDMMRGALAQAGELVSEQIASLRSIITELRPAALDELGLAPALTSLLEGFASRSGLELRQGIDLPDRRLAVDQETVVYRLVQEALTNVVKHARAGSVDVEVALAGERIQVCVADDGVGFDPDAPVSGFGLAGMRERVALAGGEIEIAPGGRGTTVRASMPAAYADDGSLTSPRSIA
jgi:signal transduction histidine kinase